MFPKHAQRGPGFTYDGCWFFGLLYNPTRKQGIKIKQEEEVDTMLDDSYDGILTLSVQVEQLASLFWFRIYISIDSTSFYGTSMNG